jgi:hypothetical protein
MDVHRAGAIALWTIAAPDFFNLSIDVGLRDVLGRADNVGITSAFFIAEMLLSGSNTAHDNG